METFDLVVLGGGKGGKTLAMQWAQAGKKVALVERGMIGGSCINVACIPTKTMVRSAKVAEMARRAGEFGIEVAPGIPNFAEVRRRKREVVSQMVARNQAGFDRSGLKLFLGQGRFIGPKALEVEGTDRVRHQVQGEILVVNTGTRPDLPPVPGLAGSGALNSERIQELDRLPEHLVVFGGGYIGCEFAQIFRRLGSRVTLVDRNSTLVPREEPEISAALQQVFQEEGIELVQGAALKKVDGKSGSGVRIQVEIAGAERWVEGSDLLVALGRIPNTEGLQAELAGIGLDTRGYVVVDEYLRTTAAGVWAMGDVTGGPQFTHASLDDYRIVSANLEGGQRSTRNRLMPYTLFTDPELGRVGITEAEARKKGIAVKVARLPAGLIPRAVTLGETGGLLKAVVDKETDRILGVSILAAEGGEIMAVVQMAMQGGLTAKAVRDTIFSHPTMAESLNDLFGRLE